jgi:hypothetical protein
MFKAKQRDLNWTEGDALAILVDRYGESVIKDCASHGWGRAAHLSQIERVAKAFSPDERLSDVAWSWYRASYQASTRVENETPFEILMKALDHDWKLADIARYGKEQEIEFILVESCPRCGTQYAMRRSELLIDTINCPVCAKMGIETPLGTFIRKE